MTRPQVFISNPVHPLVLAALQETADVDMHPGPEPLDRDAFLDRARRADALMVFMNDSLDRDTLRACPRLKVVAAALKGYDNFDVPACTELGIWFSAVPDLLTEPTAELALGLAVGLARKIREGDRAMRSGAFAGWRPRLYGTGLHGRLAGIVGMGPLGRAIARRLDAFGARVCYADPHALQAGLGSPLAPQRLDFGDLAGRADFLFLALPLGPATRHLVNAETLARMKPGAFLVNVGRGSVVDETAVAAALDGGRLGGYAADVFEMEDWALPDRPAAIQPALLKDDARTLFTPHLGSADAQVRLDIELRAARNILEALQDRRPPDAVNAPRSLKEDARAESA